MTYTFNGSVIAEDEEQLKSWIMEHCTDAFNEWVDNEYPEVRFHTCAFDPSDLLIRCGYYADEMEWWVDNVVMSDAYQLGNLGIDQVATVPLDERSYKIEMIEKPWNVYGLDVVNYYEDALEMDVGDTYENDAYRVIRTKNARRMRR